MSNQDELLYQGVSRRSFLGYLHRLCIVQYRDDLMIRLCVERASGTIPETFIKQAVTAWNQVLQQALETIIRNNDGSGRVEMARSVLSLLFDADGQAEVIRGVLDQLCVAHRKQDNSQLNQILWNVLSQHFKDKMDQLDGFGGGPGIHRLQVMRRIDRLRRDLVDRRNQTYTDMAELATDLLAEIQTRKLSNMPGTVRTILEYLYELDARYQASLDDDTQHIDLIAEFMLQPDTLIQFEQCLERLSGELYQALAIKHSLGNEPVFLREDDFKQHYGFGWETLRKRAAQALRLLIDCISGKPH